MARRALSTSLLLLLSSDRAAAGATEAEADLQRTGMNATGHIAVSNDDSTALLDERGQAVGTGGDEATVVGMNATGMIRTGSGDDRYSAMETAAEVEGAKKAKKELQVRAKTGGAVSQREGASNRLESATFSKSKAEAQPEYDADKEREKQKLIQGSVELNTMAAKLMSHVDHTNFEAIATLRKLKANAVLSEPHKACLKIEEESKKNKDKAEEQGKKKADKEDGQEDDTLKYLEAPCKEAAKLMLKIETKIDDLISHQEAIGKQINEAQVKGCDFGKCTVDLKKTKESGVKEDVYKARQTLNTELIAQADKNRELALEHHEKAMNEDEHDPATLEESHDKAAKHIKDSNVLLTKAEEVKERRQAGTTNGDGLKEHEEE